MRFRLILVLCLVGATLLTGCSSGPPKADWQTGDGPSPEFVKSLADPTPPPEKSWWDEHGYTVIITGLLLLAAYTVGGIAYGITTFH